MNRDQFSNNFQQLKVYILDRWNRLTDEDLRQINGRFESFVTKVQDKYGISREEVEEQFRNWAPNLRFDRERDVSLARRKEEEPSSVGKWVLAAGIPFLFLLGYLGTHYNNPTVGENRVGTTTSDQTLYTTTSANGIDNNATLSQNVRKILFANSQLLRDLKDVRIESSSGVVTIYGSVATEDEKTLISRIVEKISGVVRVDNRVEVR